jgi:hypothetical protein
MSKKLGRKSIGSVVATMAVTAIVVITTIKTATTVKTHALPSGADHLPLTAISPRSVASSVTSNDLIIAVQGTCLR